MFLRYRRKSAIFKMRKRVVCISQMYNIFCIVNTAAGTLYLYTIINIISSTPCQCRFSNLYGLTKFKLSLAIWPNLFNVRNFKQFYKLFICILNLFDQQQNYRVKFQCQTCFCLYWYLFVKTFCLSYLFFKRLYIFQGF